MPLKLMYITNQPEIAIIAENAGVDSIFVDMEYIGKAERQGGMNTVQSHHTLEDIVHIRKRIKKSELLVRCNPIHNETSNYISSEKEINSIIENGADTIMLPYFKTISEVEKFIEIIDKRVNTMLLVETPESVDCIDEILNLKGINYIHIGINDLSLGYHKKFMFELLIDGTVEKLCNKFRKAGIPYGFGGIASLGKGLLPAENVIIEHYKLGSSMAILSRSFCNSEHKTIDEINVAFNNGIKEIRNFEVFCSNLREDDFSENSKVIDKLVKNIINTIG